MEKIRISKLNGMRRNCLIFSSKFSVLFPQYQENYLRESWNIISRVLRPYGIESKIDLPSGKMEVKLTKKAKDPFVIFKARDFLKLLARSVPIQQACKIFEDEIFCDIVKISNLRLSKEKFLKRRKRIIGQRGLTVRAIEIVTQCYLLVQGSTVSCMGKHEGLKMARKIIQACMANVHPISQVKMLWFKNCLSQNPNFKFQSWESFFPSNKKISSKNQNSFLQYSAKTKKKRDISEQEKEKVSLYEERGVLEIKENKFFLKKNKVVTSFPH